MENQYLKQATNDVINNTNNAFDAYNQYANQGIGALNTGATQAQQSLQSGNAQANSYLNPYSQGGATAFQTLLSQFTGGDGTAQGSYQSNPLYQAIYGPNAMQNFQNTPGYQFTQQQGINAANASANTAGLLGSGAQQKALAAYGTNLANQTYQQYVGNQQSIYGTYLNGLTSASNQGLTAAGQQSTLASNLGSNLANVQTNLSTNLNNAYTNIGTADAQRYSTIGNALATNQYNMFNQQQAQQTQSGAAAGYNSAMAQGLQGLY